MSEPFGIELAVRQCESGTASATVQKAVAARFRERTSKLVRASVRILDLLAEIARLREERGKCVWTDYDGSRDFETACGEYYSLRQDLDLYNYCPFCGGVIEQQEDTADTTING